MTEGDALLAEIAAHPDQDDLRLIFADWCEDQGQTERGEFIRVQIELAGPYDSVKPGEVIRFSRLWKREEELWAKMADEALHAEEPLWGMQFPCPMSGWSPNALHFDDVEMVITFARGFPSSASLPQKTFLKVGKDLRRRFPLVRVELSDVTPLNNNGVFGFRNHDLYCASHADRKNIPPSQFDLDERLFSLPGAVPVASLPWWKELPDATSATSALSAACLKWAES